MTVRELRRKFLEFFESKDHQRAAASPLIPYDVTGKLDETLLFNGSGMNQFKPYFRGVATPPHKRLITAQKCLRTGDIEDVGDSSHLTMFEMLGNFSFGDYFKLEAIDFSWEFLTSSKWLNLDPKRLAFTVFETDDEAYERWANHFRSVGIAPENRIFRLGEETNYWPAGAFSKGPPGPCGPNSEMFYWVVGDPPSGDYSKEQFLADEDERKWLEIWNDVFISYEWQGKLKNPARPDQGYEKTGMPDLPFQSIDTGMGLERTATALGGFESVYDTDAFQPIFRRMEEVAERPFRYGESAQVTRAMRIISDHSRSASFCIGDGILPSNNGRGYVLRRLIRRAILVGVRQLGFEHPFLPKLVDPIRDLMGDDYPELVEKYEVICQTLENEEQLFCRTLRQGSELLTEWLEELKEKQLDGDRAFMLYDTFGFPLEVTIELCSEAGVTVDEERYREAMIEAQNRSRGASSMEGPYTKGSTEAPKLANGEDVPLTQFTGYHASEDKGTLLFASDTIAIFDRTPFYAESGGQVGDTGVITFPNGSSFQVLKTVKDKGLFFHHLDKSASEHVGQTATMVVDGPARKAITRHHTATHLMHAALRKVLGNHVTQAGSLVDADQLRFDFTHGAAMTREEIFAVEQLVQEQILVAQPITTYEDVPIQDARKMGAMALFGEKYADRVRVVQIGGMTPSESSYSRELCGGVHVTNTGEIGLFKIVHESSAASGIRRISAVAGFKACEHIADLQGLLFAASDRLKSTPPQLLSAVERLQEQLREERKKREKLAANSAGSETVEPIGSFELAVERISGADADDLKRIIERLAGNHTNRVAIVINEADGKVQFLVKVGSDAVKGGANAGSLVKAMATLCGGGGGGRPDFAQAGGRDPSKIDDAIAVAREQLSK